MSRSTLSSRRQALYRAFSGVAALIWLQVSFAGTERPSMETRLDQMLSRFPGADLNHDGKLTLEEFKQYRSATAAGSVSTQPTNLPTPTSTPPVAPPNATPIVIEISSGHPVPINPKI